MVTVIDHLDGPKHHEIQDTLLHRLRHLQVEVALVVRLGCDGESALQSRMSLELKVWIQDRPMFHLHRPKGVLEGYNLVLVRTLLVQSTAVLELAA